MVGQVIAEWCWRGTVDFTGIGNIHRLKRGTVGQIVRPIPHFSRKVLYSFEDIFAVYSLIQCR